MKLITRSTTLALLLTACALPRAHAQIVNGGQLFVMSPSNVIATFLASDAGDQSQLFLVSPTTSSLLFDNTTSTAGDTVNLGSFPVGTELIFELRNVSAGQTFQTGPGSRNSDGVPHAQVNYGVNPIEVGFEDRIGGDFDYDDLRFSFTNILPSPSQVPEPGTWALFVTSGLSGGAFVLRRRRNQA